jgi:hypothetical protein
MARQLTLVRTEAEWLIDLLESCDPEEEGSWRHDMADDIRKLFGMVSYEIEQTKQPTWQPLRPT